MSQDPYVYAIRTCQLNMESHHSNNFVWPTSGMVYAPDWEKTRKCGNGLHACLLNSKSSDFKYLNLAQEHVKYLVLKILRSDILYIDGKIKFPKCEVIFTHHSRYMIKEFLRSKFPEFNKWVNNYLFKHDVVFENIKTIENFDNAKILDLSNCKYVHVDGHSSEFSIDYNTLVDCQDPCHIHVKDCKNTIILHNSYTIIEISSRNNKIITNGFKFVFYFNNDQIQENNRILTNDKVIKLHSNYKLDTLYRCDNKGNIGAIQIRKPTRNLPK